jgi:putative membrane protein
MSESGDSPATPQSSAPPGTALISSPLRLIRVAVAGVLMGMANLIPGVSGGTMVLAMGLYQDFIDSVADITSLRLSVRRIVFLGVLGGFALAAIALLAKVILYLLFHYPVGMYALFIGLTLGGAPTIVRSLRPIRADVVIATIVGIALMVGVLLLKLLQGGGFPHNTVMDVVAGVVGATTMVLPGVSGSYMLAVMDQYGRVVGAVDDRNLAIIIPVGIGVVVGIVGLAHLLKILLHRHERVTLGVLLGILLGSVAGLWPFGKAPEKKILERRDARELAAFVEHWALPAAASTDHAALVDHIEVTWAERSRRDYEPALVGRAALLVVIGYVVTWSLGRMRAAAPPADEMGDAPQTG